MFSRLRLPRAFPLRLADEAAESNLDLLAEDGLAADLVVADLTVELHLQLQFFRIHARCQFDGRRPGHLAIVLAKRHIEELDLADFGLLVGAKSTGQTDLVSAGQGNLRRPRTAFLIDRVHVPVRGKRGADFDRARALAAIHLEAAGQRQFLRAAVARPESLRCPADCPGH